jgi:hypothetical protein
MPSPWSFPKPYNLTKKGTQQHPFVLCCAYIFQTTPHTTQLNAIGHIANQVPIQAKTRGCPLVTWWKIVQQHFVPLPTIQKIVANPS